MSHFGTQFWRTSDNQNTVHEIKDSIIGRKVIENVQDKITR